MTRFRVLVSGANFLLNIDDKPLKAGLFTTRTVVARNAEEAEYLAVDLVREDPKLKERVLNDPEDSPMLYAEETKVVDESEDDINTGFSWYSEDEDE